MRGGDGVSTLRSYVDAMGRLPADALLGYIALSTGADGEHDRGALSTLFEATGLNSALIPQTSRAIDAFKKATRAKNDYKYLISRDSEARVQFREVASSNTAEVTLRVVMREKRIDARSSLGWERVGELKLYRSPRRGGVVDDSGARLTWLMTPDLEDVEKRNLISLIGQVKAEYERFRSSLDGIKVRQLILDYMRGPLEAVSLKPSVNFVPISHADELHRLSEAIGTLEGCRISLVPLVDLAEQRDQILGAFQEENEADLIDLVSELQRARTSSVTPKVYAQLRRRYDDIMARSEHYAELLDASIDRTTGVSDVATASLAALSREFMNREGPK